MNTSNTKVSKLLLICASALAITGPAWSATYDQYENQKRQVESRVKNQRLQKSQNESRLKGFEDKKRQVIQSAKEAIRSAGTKKGLALQAKLSRERDEARWVDKISKEYIEKQRELSDRYQTLLTEFRGHQKTDPAVKATVAEVHKKISSAKILDDVATGQMELHHLLTNELGSHSHLKSSAQTLTANFRQNYRQYEEEINRHREFMEEHKYPKLTAARGAIDTMESLISYVDKRNAFYVDLIHQKINEFTEKRQSLALREIKGFQAERSSQKGNWESSLEFIDKVKGLVSRVSHARSNGANPSGKEWKLKPIYEAYTEALAFKPICAKTDDIENGGKAQRAGCLILSGLFPEAEYFMKEEAYLFVKAHLFNWSTLPDRLQPRVEALYQMVEVENRESRDFNRLIDRHDEFVDVANREVGENHENE